MLCSFTPATVNACFFWIVMFMLLPPLTLSANCTRDTNLNGFPFLTSEGVNPWKFLKAVPNESDDSYPNLKATSIIFSSVFLNITAASVNLLLLKYSESVVSVRIENKRLNIEYEYPDNWVTFFSSISSSRTVSR